MNEKSTSKSYSGATDINVKLIDESEHTQGVPTKAETKAWASAVLKKSQPPPERSAPVNPGPLALILIGLMVLLSMIVEYLSTRFMPSADYHFGMPLTDADWHPEILACLVLLPIAFFIASYYRRRRIYVDDGGITVNTQEKYHVDRQFILWRKVASIKVTNLALEQVVTIETKSGDTTRFLWRHLKESMDPAEFFSAVRAYCPGSLPRVVPELSDASNHTHLWLESFAQSHGRKSNCDLAAGKELQDGKFRVLGILGQGGQGTAYAASVNPDNQESDGLPAEVVLKEYILPMHHFKTQSILTENAEKLNQAALILERIDHPQIVRMFGHFVEDYRGYLVMERVEGISLKELVAGEGKQPESVVIEMAEQICDILDYLHTGSYPIVHRDLTPDNLILQVDGTIKLVDFDVAHKMESSATASVVGKQAYIPPEQFRGEPVPASDLYALGCTLHYLLTGEEPEPITVSSPREICSTVTEEMDALVRQATALEAAGRFATAGDLKRALPVRKGATR